MNMNKESRALGGTARHAPAANIVITGFMGTGKTTVGRIVAHLTGRRFVDADDEIARVAGKAIPEIFAQGGEAAFRAIEREVCGGLASQSGLVIATGGGMLVDADNRRVIAEAGFVVCLSAPPGVIEARLRGGEAEARPLLKGDWRGLLIERQAAYDAIPHQVDTAGKTPHEVAQEIVALWRNASR